MPGQNTKTITFTWNAQPDAKVYVRVVESGVELWTKILDKGAHGPLNLRVTYGKSYGIDVCRFGADKCPAYLVTTKRFDIADPTATRIPQPPQIDTGSNPEPPEVNRTPQHGQRRNLRRACNETAEDSLIIATSADRRSSTGSTDDFRGA